jgi:hypothetical protein
MVARSRRSNRQGDEHLYDEDNDSSNEDDSSFSQGYDGEDDDDEDNGNEGSYRSVDSRNTLGTTSARSESESSHHELVMLPRTRIVVSGAILLVAIALGTATYLVTAKGQNQTFTSKVRMVLWREGVQPNSGCPRRIACTSLAYLSSFFRATRSTTTIATWSSRRPGPRLRG